MAELSERVLNVLEWDSVLEEISSRCATVPGRNYAFSISPLSAERIKKQQAMISEIKGLMNDGNAPDFSGIGDIAPSVELAKKNGVLSLEELHAVKKFVIASERLLHYISRNASFLSLTTEEFQNLNRLDKLGGVLIPSITESGDISDGMYPELKKMRNGIAAARQEIEKRLSGIIYSPSMDRILQEKIHSTRNDRYVILVKTEMKSAIKGTVHDISASGATTYVEPEEITGLNNRLIMQRLELQIEINRILKMLSGRIADFGGELLFNIEKLSYLDFLSSSSIFSISINGNAPEITDDYILDLHRAVHPLLCLMNPKGTVPNDISLGVDYNCLIISGANTGGKTVLLKTIGLCALLSMHGLHLPAGPDSKIGTFTGVLADIGDDQSIRQSLSSYSGQIVILKEMIESAGAGCLVLIDEIISSTDPRQGAALSQSVLEALVASGARIVVTTHYPEMKELAGADARFRNASVSFDIESLKPTYRLSTGIPGASYAFEIAKTYGISEGIIARSRELLDHRQSSGEALLENLQRHRQELEDEKRRIDEIREQASRERDEYLALQSRARTRMEEIKHEKGIEFLEELKQLRNEITEKVKNLRDDDIKSLTDLNGIIIDKDKKISKHLRKEGGKRFQNRFLPFDPRNTKSGDTVFIVPLEKQGRIEDIDEGSGSVLVILGNSIRTRYKFSDLMLPGSHATTGAGKQEPRKKAAKAKEAASNEGMIAGRTIQTKYNTVDMRGLTADEAIQKMEQDFDRMIRSGISAAFVIHGHGTGALKKAVRTHLKHSLYVNSFRPGEYGEGGDGVTIVRLKN